MSKMSDINVSKTVAIFFIGILIGASIITILLPILTTNNVSNITQTQTIITGESAFNEYDRPTPMPHRYWAETDEFYVFTSGGQQGGIIVYTVPSMKILSEIPMFNIDQKWGWTTQDVDVKEMLTNPKTGEVITFGDTHHPSLSKTNGEYDGRWLFINDKLYPRIGKIDLTLFRTTQILWIPNIEGGLHGHHTSPNGDLDVANFELEQYNSEIIDYITANTEVTTDKVDGPYVGGFAGVDISSDGTMSNAWQVWGPWHHDLLRIGSGVSNGWIVNTAYNTERAVDTVGMFAREYDYVFFWNIASIEEAINQNKYMTTTEAPDVPVISWEDVEVYMVKIPLNPHGVDISPTGKYILNSGKATTRVTAIDFDKVLTAISEKRFTGEEFGVSILDENYVYAADMDLGLGPTHIDFDNKGFAYIAFFVDSDIKKIALGEPYTDLNNMEPWTIADVIPVHYSVGHLVIAGGDTAKPYGKYLISMNKLTKDTFLPHGPLIAENHELFNIEENPAILIDQMPMLPEPHYSQMLPVDLIKDKIKNAYDLPEVIEESRVEYDYENEEVTVYMTAVRSFFDPNVFNVPEGWKVNVHLTNIELSVDLTHGFAIEGHDVSIGIDPGDVKHVEFVVDEPGVYWYYCIWFCSELHMEMRGRMIVIPDGEWNSSLESVSD